MQTREQGPVPVVIERSRKNAQVRRRRRVASFIDKGTFLAKETFFHHPPGIRGPGFAGGPIVRDRNEELSDPAAWSDDASADRLERRYYATDWQGRVVSLVTAAGELAESYRYTANGVPIGIPLGDVNGDGKVEVGANDEDWQQAYWWENNYGPYDARLDLNLDGSVNATDIGLVGSQSPGTMPTARASAASVGNRMFASARVDREAVLGREGDGRYFFEYALQICIQSLEAAELLSFPDVDPACPWNPLETCRNDPLVKAALERYREDCAKSSRGRLKIECHSSLNDYNCKLNRVRLFYRDCGTLAHELLHAADTCIRDDKCTLFGHNQSYCEFWLCMEARSTTMGNCCDSANPWRQGRTWSECVSALKKWYFDNADRFGCRGTPDKNRRAAWDKCAAEATACGGSIPRIVAQMPPSGGAGVR